MLRVILMAPKKAGRSIVPVEPLLNAFHFPETTDRNKAGYALFYLLEKCHGTDRWRVYKERVLEAAGELLAACSALDRGVPEEAARRFSEFRTGLLHHIRMEEMEEGMADPLADRTHGPPERDELLRKMQTA